ncbi:MAG: hypothetical protein E7576_02695 [Ruminococcaceae bacterium]|jgi:hypothetical protein|nr:hypothetical protein [Oscillospiraceae bacterium]
MKNTELLFDTLGEIDPGLLPIDETETEPEVGSAGSRAGLRRRRWEVVLAAAAVAVFFLASTAAGVIAVRFRVSVADPASVSEEAEDGGEGVIGRLRELFTVWIEGWNGAFVTLPDGVLETLEGLAVSDPDRSEKVYLGEDGSVYDSRTPEEREKAGESLLFGSWEDAADFLGCGMLTSPLLSGAGDGEKIELGYNNGDEAHRGIRSVHLWNTVIRSGARCMTSVVIPLNRESVEAYSGGHSTNAPDARTGEPGEWVSGQGFDVLLMSYRVGRDMFVSAQFEHGGIIYRVIVVHPSYDTAKEKVTEIVESMR